MGRKQWSADDLRNFASDVDFSIGFIERCPEAAATLPDSVQSQYHAAVDAVYDLLNALDHPTED